MTELLTPPLAPASAVELSALARAPRLLLALDFDGVLAPLVDDPAASRMLPESAEAIAALIALPGTRVALVSGRDVATLRGLAAPPPGVWLVGSHGAEADLGSIGSSSSGAADTDSNNDNDNGGAQASAPALATALTESERALLSALDARLESLSDLRVERKPFSRTVHTRGLDAAQLASAQTRVASIAEALPAFRVIVGHDIVEFAARTVTKGDGIRALLAAAGPDAILCLGDDVTDEDAFSTLAEVRAESLPNSRSDSAARPAPDAVHSVAAEPGHALTTLSIKVGKAATCADARIADPAAVATLLARLAEERTNAHVHPAVRS